MMNKIIIYEHHINNKYYLMILGNTQTNLIFKIPQIKINKKYYYSRA
jgi:hypothetical protein